MIPQDDNSVNRSLELCRRVVTTESFIAEAKEIYGDKYDYSKVDYKNREHQVVLGCSVHGDFKIFAREHLDGKGCPKCAKGEKFIQKLQEKFGNKFLLDKFIYESSTSPVELICPIHGSFMRTTNEIIKSKFGCPACAEKVREDTHLQAEEKKNAERQDRINAEIEQRKQQMYDYEVQCNSMKRNIEISCDIRTKVYNYHNLVDARIEFVQYQTKWIKTFQEKYIVKPDMLLDNSLYAEGDTVYCFPNEAPDEDIIANYLKSRFSNSYSFNRYLSKRQCAVYFQGRDLFILYKPHWYQEYNDSTYLFTKENISESKSYHKAKQKTNITLDLPESFVGIDFETLYSQRVSACSVGMVKYKDGQIVDRYYSLIRPPFEYPGKCGAALTWIHGFTEEMLQNERTFEEVLPEMETFVEGLPLVAHNACVERACIRDTAEFYGITTSLDYTNIIDTYPLSKKVEQLQGCEVTGAGTHSLDAVCRRFNVPEMHHHDALDDAEMCGNLLLVFKEILSNKKMVVQPIEKEVAVTPKIKAEDKIQRTDMENVQENPFKNKTVVLTGFAKADSQQYAHQLNELGAIIKDNVNKKTNILITGYNAGPSKLKKAEEFGVQIIPENEFIKMLKSL